MSSQSNPSGVESWRCIRYWKEGEVAGTKDRWCSRSPTRVTGSPEPGHGRPRRPPEAPGAHQGPLRDRICPDGNVANCVRGALFCGEIAGRGVWRVKTG